MTPEMWLIRLLWTLELQKPKRVKNTVRSRCRLRTFLCQIEDVDSSINKTVHIHYDTKTYETITTSDFDYVKPEMLNSLMTFHWQPEDDQDLTRGVVKKVKDGLHQRIKNIKVETDEEQDDDDTSSI